MSSSMPNASSGARDSAGTATPGAASANAQSSAAAANRAADPAATGNDATTSSKASTSKAPQKASSDARDAKADFDALLADATAPAAASASPVAAPLPPTALNQAAEAPAETALPDQLLALINGSWALSPAATPAGNIALADAAPGAASPALAQTNPPGLAQAAIDLPATTPVDGAVPVPATSDDPGAIALSALAAMAEPDSGASGAIDAADSSGLIAELGSTEPPQLPTTSATTALGAARTTSAAPTAVITLPADPDAGFDDAFGSRIVWLAEQRLGHAEIRITPDHAGPIDVRLQLDGNRVSADFQSANPDVRQALEASMTRLRDMLGQHGMQLAHAGVGHGQSDRRGGAMATPGLDAEHDAALDPRMSASPIRSRGLLDEYA